MKTVTRSNFVKVKCSKCKNEQIIFSNASTNVKCLVCDSLLSESKGGKSKIIAKIVETLE